MNENSEPSKPKKYFQEDPSQEQEISYGFFMRNLPWIIGLTLILLIAGGTYTASRIWASDKMKEPLQQCLILLGDYAPLTDRIGVGFQRTSDEPVGGRFQSNYQKVYALMDKFELAGEKGSAIAYGTMVKPKDNMPWSIFKLKVDFEDGSSIMIPPDEEGE